MQINKFKPNYMYCLRHDPAFQCVVSDQPLHRWLVFSRFYVCRFVSPKFQHEGIKIYKILEIVDGTDSSF